VERRHRLQRHARRRKTWRESERSEPRPSESPSTVVGGARHCRARGELARSPAHRAHRSGSADVPASPRRVVGGRPLPKHPGARALRSPTQWCSSSACARSPRRGARRGLEALAAVVPVPIASISIRACPKLRRRPRSGSSTIARRPSRLRHVSRASQPQPRRAAGRALVRPRARVSRRGGGTRRGTWTLSVRDGAIDRAALEAKHKLAAAAALAATGHPAPRRPPDKMQLQRTVIRHRVRAAKFGPIDVAGVRTERRTHADHGANDLSDNLRAPAELLCQSTVCVTAESTRATRRRDSPGVVRLKNRAARCILSRSKGACSMKLLTVFWPTMALFAALLSQAPTAPQSRGHHRRIEGWTASR